jgi:hypothetical protein
VCWCGLSPTSLSSELSFADAVHVFARVFARWCYDGSRRSDLRARCGYLAGFVRSRAYDVLLHVIGGPVTPDSQGYSMDPYVKLSKVADDDAAAGSGRMSETEGPASLADPNVRRTKILRATTHPIWREVLGSPAPSLYTHIVHSLHGLASSSRSVPIPHSHPLPHPALVPSAGPCNQRGGV